MEPISARRIRITPATEPLASAERGMALITVIMVMMLVSALMIGFVSAIVADNRSSGLDHDQTQAYAAAHAGLEKLTSDLSALFGGDVSPSKAQIDALLTKAPSVTGFKFKEPDDSGGYKVTWDFAKANGDPDVESPTGSTITHGPYQGFKGLITPYNIVVTARSDAGGAEVRMKRTLQTIAVPVFQFGVFSETDLAFHAGETFTFGGRVHTNGNLFLAEATGETLTISDRITAVADVIRTHLPNGLVTTSGYTGAVKIPTTIMSNPVNNVYRALALDEGSAKGTIGSLPNTKWTALSISTYNSNIRTGDKSADGIGTGAKKLDLPLVSYDAQPIDLIRRPRQGSNEDTADRLVYQQRYFGMRATSLRILLSDTAAEISTLPTIDNTVAPTSLNTVLGIAYAAGKGTANQLPPLAASPALGGLVADGALPAGTYKNGFVSKIEPSRKNAGTVYVAYDLHYNDDPKPYLFKTTDFGKTWTTITNDLPAWGTTYVIREDPHNERVLYVGTESGLFVSIDGGDHWVRWKGTLPHTAVRSLVVHPRERELVVGTFGRSIWVGDVSVIEQLEEALGQSTFLYEVKPAVAHNIRYRYGTAVEEINGDMFFRAPNPPYGATISYSLKEAAGRDVKVTITDAGGRTVRSLTGPGTAGLHHVQWDLETDAAKAQPAPGIGPGRDRSAVTLSERQRRRRVMPATYTATLEVGATRLTRPVVVKAEAGLRADTASTAGRP